MVRSFEETVNGIFFAEIYFVSKKISIFAIEMQLFTTLINRGPLMGLLKKLQ